MHIEESLDREQRLIEKTRFKERHINDIFTEKRAKSNVRL